MRKLSTLALAVAAAPFASAQFFTEFFINPASTDNGWESVEIQGPAGLALNGVTFIAIEGDGANAGIIDTAVSLDGVSLGSNGLLLIRDGAANTFTYGLASGTATFVQDFNPDLENGSITFLLVTNFTGAVGQDLDTNNDGVLDSQPWTLVLDAVGSEDSNPGTDTLYGAAVGFEDVKNNIDPNGEGFGPNILYAVLNGTRTARVSWAGGDQQSDNNANPEIWEDPQWFGLPFAPVRPLTVGVQGDQNPDGITDFGHINLGVQAAFLEGAVTLNEYGPGPVGVIVRVEIRNPGTTTPIETYDVPLGTGGAFQIPTNLVGTYDVAIKGLTWLRQVQNLVFTSTGVSGAAFSLLNGDVDGNNSVGLSDYTILTRAWRATPTSSNWDRRADLDGNNTVGLSDYLILSRNWRRTGNP